MKSLHLRLAETDLKSELQQHTQGSTCGDRLHPCVYLHSVRFSRQVAA